MKKLLVYFSLFLLFNLACKSQTTIKVLDVKVFENLNAKFEMSIDLEEKKKFFIGFDKKKMSFYFKVIIFRDNTINWQINSRFENEETCKKLSKLISLKLVNNVSYKSYYKKNEYPVNIPFTISK